MNPRLKGYCLGITAAATYGMNPLFALPLYSAGMTADSVLFFRYAMAIPLLACMTAIRGRSFRVTRRQTLTLAALGLLMALSSLSLFLSYNYMDAGIASTILFVYPVMVAVIMAAFYRERLSPVMIASITLALGGIGLLYRTGDGQSLSLAGTALALASALTYAIYIRGRQQIVAEICGHTERDVLPAAVRRDAIRRASAHSRRHTAASG